MDNILERSLRLERAGDVEQACQMRWAAAQEIIRALPEDDAPEMEWESAADRDTLMLLDASAIDHFLSGDWELCAALWETLLDLDPEDHLEASRHLGYVYGMMGEWELFDEVLHDISDKSPDKSLLTLWGAWQRERALPEGELHHLKNKHTPFFLEFTAAEHPADESYVKEIESARPSKSALARELWLQTEHLWSQHPDFLAALRG